MTEALDTEFGRIMVETGLATRNANGTLKYDPKASNTVIVIVGDNGTLGNAVKLPFNAQEAKGTAYQTGVWDPLIVAGPMVVAPDREVNHTVNMVDLFPVFGELAGLDAHALVLRTLDPVGLLPYLTKVDQSSLRTINFTQGGYNIQANGGQKCTLRIFLHHLAHKCLFPKVFVRIMVAYGGAPVTPIRRSYQMAVLATPHAMQ